MRHGIIIREAARAVGGAMIKGDDRQAGDEMGRRSKRYARSAAIGDCRTLESDRD